MSTQAEARATVAWTNVAVARAVELGGEIVSGPRAGFCIVRDPAGAFAALYQQP